MHAVQCDINISKLNENKANKEKKIKYRLEVKVVAYLCYNCIGFLYSVFGQLVALHFNDIEKCSQYQV